MSSLDINALETSEQLLVNKEVSKSALRIRGLHLDSMPAVPDSEVIPLITELRGKFDPYLDADTEESKGGFDTIEAFSKESLKTNEVWVKEKRIYDNSPSDFYPEDPEIPGKKQSRVLVECADGRNSPTLFMKKDQLTGRYAIEWLPYAGLIIFPEVESGMSQDELEKKLLADLGLKQKVFARLDMVFGQKVKEFLELKAGQPELAKLDFEFQSHFHGKTFPHHGCGAHCSDFNLAQAETIKNVFLVDFWLKEKYPKHYKAGDFRVYRTGHDTGDGGNVYSGSYLDETRVSPEYHSKHRKMFEQATKFKPPRVDQFGVTQHYQKKYLKIDVEEHDEQTIRLSQTHFGHTLKGQSVLEISWTDSPELILAHLKVLLGIVDKNYRKHHPEKPAIMHLDIPARNYEIASIYEKLRSLILADPEIRDRISQNILKILVTQTDPKTLKSREISF